MGGSAHGVRQLLTKPACAAKPPHTTGAGPEGPCPRLHKDRHTHKYICWVLTQRAHGRLEHLSIRLGQVRVDERPVLARTTQSHESHQPYGDARVEEVSDQEPAELDFSTWRDVSVDGYAALPTADESAPLAPVQRVMWQPSRPIGEIPYFVTICGGEIGYPLDMPDIMHRMTGGQYAIVNVDRASGGHGQDITIKRNRDALCQLVSHTRCIGVGFSPECKWVSALLCLDGGPNMVFNLEHPGGIPDLSDADQLRQRAALEQYEE